MSRRSSGRWKTIGTWLSRDREQLRWDIIRAQLPQTATAGAFPGFDEFRDAVIALARQQVDTADYDVNSDGVIDAAWLITSSGDIYLPYAIGGASRNFGANVFVDGQASGSVVAGATGNFNHELVTFWACRTCMAVRHDELSDGHVVQLACPSTGFQRLRADQARMAHASGVVGRRPRECGYPRQTNRWPRSMVPTSHPFEYFLIEYRKGRQAATGRRTPTSTGSRFTMCWRVRRCRRTRRS